jgi:hypothetical protein
MSVPHSSRFFCQLSSFSFLLCICLPFSLFVIICLSIFFILFCPLSLLLSVHLTFSVYFSVYVYLSFSVYFSFYVYQSFSVCLYVPISITLCLSIIHCLCAYIYLSFTVYVPISFSVYLSFIHCLSIFLSPFVFPLPFSILYLSRPLAAGENRAYKQRRRVFLGSRSIAAVSRAHVQTDDLGTQRALLRTRARTERSRVCRRRLFPRVESVCTQMWSLNSRPRLLPCPNNVLFFSTSTISRQLAVPESTAAKVDFRCCKNAKCAKVQKVVSVEEKKEKRWLNSCSETCSLDYCHCDAELCGLYIHEERGKRHFFVRCKNAKKRNHSVLKCKQSGSPLLFAGIDTWWWQWLSLNTLHACELLLLAV